MPFIIWGSRGITSHLETGDFYCPRCVEHVTIPECILSRIPLGTLTAGD